MRHVRFTSLAALLAIAVLALAACGGSDDGGGDAPAAGTTTGTTMDGMEMEEEGAAAAAATGVQSPASDLRLTLDRLLGEHALLAQFATQKGYAGEKDFKVIGAALDENSVELSEAIGSVYGDEAQEEFLNGDLKWRPHIGFFVDYTVGLAKKDKPMQKTAVGNLKGYTQSFSAFLAQATELPQPALRANISEHVTQLKGQIDAYSAGKYDESYGQLREAYAHMFMTGDTLADGIVNQSPEKFDGAEVSDSAADLRVTLGRLLGEHAILATVATQKGYSGSKDFKAIAAALDANSVELADAIGSVYGDEARAKFLDGQLLWRDHIGFFVDYTTALAKKDKQGQNKAVGNLKGYIEAFSKFLADATGLPQAALRTSITEHVNQLKGQIDAYAGADYAKAYSLMREAYAHMYMTGDTLADAIVKQSPEKFSS
jgi:hypothetical protein